jgi:hypothetical protein
MSSAAEAAASAAAAAKKAVTAAINSFDKHLKPALANLRRRFLYTLKCTPPVLEDLGVAATNTFFGCKASEWGPEFRLEWKEYCEVWPAIKDRDTLRSSAFWRFKEATWPHLAPVSRFWLEIPTSAISCERAIAKMRVFDTAERQSQKDDTFKREMFFRCNMWVLEKVHDSVLSKYSAVIDARRKASAAPRPPAAPRAAAASAIEID